jgi:hypothetical protein
MQEKSFFVELVELSRDDLKPEKIMVETGHPNRKDHPRSYIMIEGAMCC